MVTRAFFSLVLSFVLAAVGLVIFPELGRVAGPLICEGVLEPEYRAYGLRYHCIEAADGAVTQLGSERVIRLSVPLLAALLLVPVHMAMVRNARRAREAEGTMHNDLSSAITARAEVLRIVRNGNLKRQMLLRAAELRLVLWVQPPNGRPYEATVSWIVEEHNIGRLSIGAVIPVQINPRRPENVYPAQPWAHYAWWS